MSYDNLIHQREQLVDHVSTWWWLKSDTGAWGADNDGPRPEFVLLKDMCLPLVRDRRLIITAGGCLGMYPRLWSKYFETVITFEPDPLNFHCLVLNCQDDRIVKINGALGNQRGMMQVNKAPAVNVGMHTVSPSHVGRVPTFRIDDLNLAMCSCISLDVERSELEVLRGAIETIKRHRPVITIETCNREIEQLLIPLGYKFIGRAGVDQVLAAR